MGQHGGFFKGDKKKIKRSILEKKAQQLNNSQSSFLPPVEIIKKGQK